MFKDEKQTWLYFLGILILFITVIFFTRNFWIPLLSGQRDFTNLSQFAVKEPGFTIDVKNDYIAEIKTNFGNITVDLYEKNSPMNVNNFIYLSNQNYYDEVTFFRIIPNLLAQSGDRKTTNSDIADDGLGNTGYVVKDEVNFKSIGLNDERIKKLEEIGYKSEQNVISQPITELSLVMASAGPKTNSSQFFIILAKKDDTRIAELQGRFTVIGGVINGLDVIQKIKNIPVDNPNLVSPRPQEEIKILDVVISNR